MCLSTMSDYIETIKSQALPVSLTEIYQVILIYIDSWPM